MTKKYLIQIHYLGTHYVGWQRQLSGVTIQQKIEEALAILFRKEISLVSASRTDQGVHSIGQMAHFELEEGLMRDIFLTQINGLLPKDIRVVKVQKVPDDFHARFCAKGKRYLYRISRGITQSPFDKETHFHCHYPLDVARMQRAMKALIGTHNFYAFTSHPAHFPESFNFVRTLFRAEAIEREGYLDLYFEGGGFLRKMIRNITGTLIDIGRGRLPEDHIEKLLISKERTKAGLCAPPHGLILLEVFYDLALLEGQMVNSCHTAGVVEW